MTRLLEEAFEEVSKLPEGEQDAIAAWLLQELASEQRWQKLLAESQDMLGFLADQALADYRQGRTLELDPDKL